MPYNIAIIGATGIVGKEFLKLLENSDFQINSLKLFASEKSLGKKIVFQQHEYEVQRLTYENLKDIDIAVFAAGSKISKEFIPKIKNTTYCIDMSSAYRMHKDVPLIIPEINKHLITKDTRVIASPNCTTTIMLMALYKIDKLLSIRRIVASTYQAASGGGKKLIDKLLLDIKNALNNKLDTDTYGFNLFLHKSPLDENRYNEEEMKMINETRKILDNYQIQISATCVRVPVMRAHSMALNVEFKKEFKLDDIYEELKQTKNVKIVENYDRNSFATPQIASGKNEVLISRVRKDLSNPATLDMWVCADQLLKGASLNSFQILNYLICL